jgi:hypothetical protein
MQDRRSFLQRLALSTGAVILMPAVSRCGAPQASAPAAAVRDPNEPLRTEPAGWNAIAYNRERGNAGFIPATYQAAINAESGPKEALGKHLPYLPEVGSVPAGFMAVMWGDPSKGHGRHPNAVKSEANNHVGHWYDWIRVRKAEEGETEELQSSFSDWPGTAAADNGAYAVFGEGDITADGGKNTIYLAALPAEVKSGDRVRIWAHCLTHGEYVAFLTVP